MSGECEDGVEHQLDRWSLLCFRKNTSFLNATCKRPILILKIPLFVRHAYGHCTIFNKVRSCCCELETIHMDDVNPIWSLICAIWSTKWYEIGQVAWWMYLWSTIGEGMFFNIQRCFIWITFQNKIKLLPHSLSRKTYSRGEPKAIPYQITPQTLTHKTFFALVA